jgi:hypothetical protein
MRLIQTATVNMQGKILPGFLLQHRRRMIWFFSSDYSTTTIRTPAAYIENWGALPQSCGAKTSCEKLPNLEDINDVSNRVTGQ